MRPARSMKHMAIVPLLRSAEVHLVRPRRAPADWTGFDGAPQRGYDTTFDGEHL